MTIICSLCGQNINNYDKIMKFCEENKIQEPILNKIIYFIGFKPSQIGVILRDNFAIPQSSLITGSKILRILKKRGVAPEIPEDLYSLMKKAVNIRKHIGKSGRDRDSKYRLILVESKIHRLVRYYKFTKQVPSNWKYDYQRALAIVS